MKIIRKNNNLIIYIPYYNKNINLSNKSDLAIYLKEIFLKIKQKYDIKLSIYYDALIYINNDYGIICELLPEKQHVYPNDIDIKVNIYYDSLFLYKLGTFSRKYKDMYFYKGDFYVKTKINIKNCEFLEIIYGDEVEEILNKGVKI